MSKRILIVDDYSSQRESLEETYLGLGYDVVTASTKEEGLAKAKEGQFDEAVLDWGLGHGQTSEEILTYLADRGTQVVINSGTDDSTGRLEKAIKGRPNVRKLVGKLGVESGLDDLLGYRAERR